MRVISRRRFIQGGLLAGAVLAGDALLLEPNRPLLQRVDLGIPRLPAEFDGFTIAQLSDFHYDPYFSVHPIRAGVEMSNRLSPDLVVLTGDFVTMPVFGQSHQRWRTALEGAPACAELLGQLRSRHGLLAVLGNHDEFSDPDRLTEILEPAGIPVLRNRSLAIERNGKRLWFAGVNDVIGGRARLDTTLERVPHDEATVLLCHEPDFADHAARYPIDLQLSGHSHGGQVRLPLVGPLYLPDLARKYPKGLRRIGNLTLYTNSGIGTVRVPVRFDCPAEVTLFTLHSGPGRASVSGM